MFRISQQCLREEFFRAASGPGGQHVNKTSSGVRLHLLLNEGCGIPVSVIARLKQIASHRIADDELIVEVFDTRSLQRNREIAFSRLNEWILRASIEPKKRRLTKPTRSSVERRLKSKMFRGKTKADRGKKITVED